jgi:hypothetical protein
MGFAADDDVRDTSLHANLPTRHKAEAGKTRTAMILT